MRINYIFIFLCTSFYATASDSLLLKIDASASFFTTDHLQNIYYIDDADELVKYEWQTKEVYTYSNSQLGKPTYIDASNPLKILVLYPDHNTLVWLDNTLSQIQLLLLNQLPGGRNYSTNTICMGQEDNTFWLFDQFSSCLIELDERGNTLKRSEAFTDMFYNAYSPKQLFFDDQKLFVHTTSNEVLLFDTFGNYINALDFESNGMLQLVNKKFIYLKSEMLFITESSLYNTTYYKLPIYDALQVQVQGNNMYVLAAHSILVFTAQY